MKEVNNRLLALSHKEVGLNAPISRIGLAVPTVRAELKKDLTFIGASETEILQYWDKVWQQSPYFESMSLALYYYQHRSLSKNEVNQLKTWANRCCCWQHSDDLSKIYAQVVEEHPAWILPSFKAWNKAKCPWKRRQSVVGLIEYQSKRNRVLPFKQLISFIEPLLADDEYYVQKGLGWTLREIYNAYPERSLSYINKNLFNLSSIAYSAATEKLDKNIKQQMNLKRRVNRKKA